MRWLKASREFIVLFLRAVGRRASLAEGRREEMIRGFRVRGRERFIVCTREVLELLADSGCLAQVAPYLSAIEEAPITGVFVRARLYEVAEPMWSHSAVWYASTIVHEACHSRMYIEAKNVKRGRRPDRSAWSGVDAERGCLTAQLEFLRKVGADPSVIAHVEAAREEPDNGGDGGWLAYFRRDW